MQILRFRCPYCAADLKVRGDEFLGRPVDCPECRQAIVVERDSAGEVTVSKHGEPAPRNRGKSDRRDSIHSKNRPQDKPVAPSLRSLREFISARLARVPLIAWVTAGAASAAAMIVGTLLVFRTPLPKQTLAGETVAAVGAAEAAFTKQSHRDPIAGTAAPKTLVAASEPSQIAAPLGPRAKLVRLAEILKEYRVNTGHFPAGVTTRAKLPPTQRLSWLAEIVATRIHPGTAAPLWGEPWSSSGNDRFVRQQIPEFLNPSFDRRVSEQNYPATHFVGIAGVGADASRLPIDHPRAGIFGEERQTRLEDIRDGAANTMMIAGVSDELGSWAAGGRASVRGLTHEPYVNGPDGFGTGSPDRMSVAMADGSVREISASIDPRLVRRMAAMADGLPLDAKIAGEPGGAVSHSPPEPLLAKSDKAKTVAPKTKSESTSIAKNGPHKSASTSSASAPGVAKKKPASPHPPVDVAAVLRQRILRFEQPRPVPLRDLLTMFEEMLAVPIQADEHEIPDFDQLAQVPIVFDLRDVTLEQVLREILAKGKLTYAIESGSIRLHKAASLQSGVVH